uniref:MAGUK p55 subfamily member 6 n=1 Tax=Schistocephalus solidus TaxID=70667 RepID=A0A0X3PJ80_SCHSO
MPTSSVQKPRHLYAASVVRRVFDNRLSLTDQLSEPLSSVLTNEEADFLSNFLHSDGFRQWLTVVDLLTAPTPDRRGMEGVTWRPLVKKVRPDSPDDRNYLLTLNEVWDELEALLNSEVGWQWPDARELYDILGDENVRGLFVTADDVANQRYTAYVDDVATSVAVYTELEADSELPSRSSSTFTSDVVTAVNPSPASASNPSLDPPGVWPNPMGPDNLTDTNPVTPTGKPPVAVRPASRNRRRASENSVNAVIGPQVSMNDPIGAGAVSAVPRRRRDSEPSLRQNGELPSPKRERSSPTNPHPPRGDVLTESPRRKRSPSAPSASTAQPRANPPLHEPHHNKESRGPQMGGGDSTYERPYNSLNWDRARHGLSVNQVAASRSSPLTDIDPLLPQPGQERLIHIRREVPGEPLGITLSPRTPSPPASASMPSISGKSEVQRSTSPQQVCVRQVLVNSLAYRDGQLYPGDILLQFNGTSVSSLEDVHTAMLASSNAPELTLLVRAPRHGVLKSHLMLKTRSPHKVYIRCLYTYDPTKDTLLPTGHKGLAFRSGEVLELVDCQDLNWWQVRRLDNPNGKTSLIPSQTLEEKRQAFNQQILTEKRKKARKIKTFFRAADSSSLLVRSDLWVYEEVVPWPPSPVHTLLLLGPNGVGRRTLKFLLCTHFPQRFAFPVSDTSDPSASQALFRIREKEQMENDIRKGAFVEWGTIDSHHYGIRFAALREVIATGRTVVLDCQVQSVHLLHQPEFNPHVVFVAAPPFETAKAMMEKGIRENLTTNRRSDEELKELVDESKTFAIRHQHLFTHTLVNSDMTEGVGKLSRLVARLEKQPGWIPAGWAYEMSLPKGFGGAGKRKEFMPGDSTLLGLGIPGLPPNAQSMIGRSSMSVLSVVSHESAARLARPPSICSSIQLPSHNISGRRLYEKRSQRARDFQPMGPPILEHSPSISSRDPSKSEAPDRRQVLERGAHKPEPSQPGKNRTPTERRVPTQGPVTRRQPRPESTRGRAEESISSTSSEDEEES